METSADVQSLLAELRLHDKEGSGQIRVGSFKDLEDSDLDCVPR